MKKVFFLFFCLSLANLTAQISFLGFDHQTCLAPLTYTYTYNNYSFGSHGYGFNIYRNGVAIYGENNGGINGPSACQDLVFINDSIGFMVKTSQYGGNIVMKTHDYGANWVIVGGGAPNYFGMHIINKNNGYLITNWGNSIWVNKFSDLTPSYDIIIDNSLNSDIYRMDTVLNSSICNIDSLSIFIKNNSDTITYHINKFIPIIGKSVALDNCAGNSIDVPFEIGTQFISGNIFTAQLSDASGSFASPLFIGSLNSIYSGTINAVLPSTITTGNGYKVRVVSTNPLFYGTDNGAKVSITAFALPSLTISASTTSLCIGSSCSLNASGASSYTWSSGVLSESVTVTPTVTTTFTLSGQSVCGVSTETISISVDSTCVYVWPGDVNRDGVANNLDVLELGLHYNQTGIARALTGNNWQPYLASAWSGKISNGGNLCNSDCNGDGIINSADTLAIHSNYSYSYSPFWSYTSPQVALIPDQSTVYKGTWGSISIYLGSPNNPIDSINGFAFTIDHMQMVDSVYIEYPISFLNSTNQNLNFQHNFPLNYSISSATTHTNNINSNGYGKIATLHYKISDSVSTSQNFNFWLLKCYKSDSLGFIKSLTTGACSIWVDAVSVNEYSRNDLFSISPNPTNSILKITSKEILQKILVTTITGEVVLSEAAVNNSHILQLQNYADGIYFVKVIYSNGMSATKMVIVSH